MEGLEISEVKYDTALKQNKDFRLDSEYFKKSYRQSQNIDNYVKLKTIATVSDGDHSKFPENQKQEIVYYQAKDIKNNYLYYPINPVYTSREYFEKNKRSIIAEENILISIMGNVGDIAITPKGFVPSLCNRAIAIVKNIYGIDPYYVFAYMITKFAFQTIQKVRNGGVQQRINLSTLSEIPIAVLSDELQFKVRDLVLLFHKAVVSSQVVYSEAQKILLQTLGLENWQPEAKNSSVKKFSDVQKSGRLDSEYYQTKYDELLDALKEQKLKRLGDIVSWKKSIEPGSDLYCDCGVPFVRVADVSEHEILTPSVFLPEDDIVTKLMPRAKKGTILLSKDGTVSIAHLLRKDLNAVTSGALLHLTVENNEYLPEYLALVLNSIVVRLQAERDANGAIIKHWKPSYICDTQIPWIDMSVQKEIAQKVQESFALREESKRLLEVAKTAVEMAIEKDEATAMEYLRKDNRAL